MAEEEVEEVTLKEGGDNQSGPSASAPDIDASALEDITEIGVDEAAGFEAGSSPDDESKKKKKKLIIFGGAGVAVLFLVIILIILLTGGEEEAITNDFDPLEMVEEKLEKPEEIHIEPSQLENMISRANYLYTHGNKQEALRLYQRIAVFSEAISQYNLGVAQMKESQYKTALQAFKNAIANGEKRCVSAINAAVCSLILNDRESFAYYLDLANAYLPYESGTKLYSYYYTLINYYKQNYLEAITSLEYPTSNEYKRTQMYMNAKLETLYGDYFDAINIFENNYEEIYSLTLAQLYANVGELSLARDQLEEAFLLNLHPMLTQLTKALILLKSGMPAETAKIFTDLTKTHEKEIYKPYPIRTFLKKSLFNPMDAQKFFRERIVKSKNVLYQKIFYFSPYKVFNAEQAISYIRKGSANIYIDDIESAVDYLQKSTTSSKANIGIAKAIQLALTFNLREANEAFQTLVKKYSKDTILHYNLGLTYAQLGNMEDANKHFLKSYYLDSSNHLAGIYALMTSQLINAKTRQLLDIIKENLAHENPNTDISLFQTLLAISQGGYIGALTWLDNNHDERPLHLVLNIILALEGQFYDRAKKDSEKLCYLLPEDILPHLIYIDTHFRDLGDSDYAKSVLGYLSRQKFSFNDLYYGPFITRFLYTQANLMTGQLYKLIKQLEVKLETTTKKQDDIISALALASIYHKEFEQAYIYYNQLIDEYKWRDPLTLMLGAVASTGAEHHANAIALLEIAKLKNQSDYEVRYALGLLYMQVNNYRGAAIQLSYIKTDSFVSQYFNFEIDQNRLYRQFLDEKMLKEKKEAKKSAPTSS